MADADDIGRFRKSNRSLFNFGSGEYAIGLGGLIGSSNSPRARARFVMARKQAKKFLLKKRAYKRPDFNRMLLDLRKLGWSHERIAHVLDITNASTVSAWSTGTRPFYENGDQLVMLWQEQTGLVRFPREGEWQTYKYRVGQLDLLDVLDDVIEQLDSEIAKR